MFILKILRMMLITIDSAIYQLVDWAYQLFMVLAETGIFKSDGIREFGERIYFFLGLIMIFKVSISILQYIMNPDAVNDNKIGAPKLLKNLVFVLVGIVAVPYIFDAAYGLQTIILRDNIIGNLILGTNSTTETAEDHESAIKNAGNEMAFSTFTAFFHFNDRINDECVNNPFMPAGSDASSDDEYLVVNKACIDDPNYAAVLDSFLGTADSTGNVALTDLGTKYKEAYELKNVHKLMFDSDLYNYTYENDEGKSEFLFDYTMLVTTAGGVFLAYILLLFCFDVAVRSVKLGFLQLIAPVPLIAKIDPKKGDETFSKWVKECTSTYVNLFARLVAIYFALYTITIIRQPYNLVTGNDEYNPLVFVFIVFGTLLFVKDLPKLIETITGMKISGGTLSLNKKLRSVPLIGGAAAQGVGFAGRTAGRTVGAFAKAGGNLANRGRLALGAGLNNAWNNSAMRARTNMAWNNSALGQMHQQRVLSGTDLASRARRLGDGISDLARGAGGLLKSADQKTGGNFGKAFSKIGDDLRQTGNELTRGTVANTMHALGIKTEAEKQDAKIEALKHYASYKEKLKSQADYNTSDLGNIKYDGVTFAVGETCKKLKQNYKDLVDSGTATKAEITAAREKWEKAQELVITGAGIDDNGNRFAINNTEVAYIKDNAAEYVRNNSSYFDAPAFDKVMNPNASYKDINDGYVAAQNEQVKIVNSQEYERAHAAYKPPKK